MDRGSLKAFHDSQFTIHRLRVQPLHRLVDVPSDCQRQHRQRIVDGAQHCRFVIARLSLDYLGEILWPGTVEIGTAVKAVGNSSLTFTQALF